MAFFENEVKTNLGESWRLMGGLNLLSYPSAQTKLAGLLLWKQALKMWFPYLLICSTLWGAGCAMVSRGSALPDQKEIVREQLVIHSDFHLPRQHRILNDLSARRHEIAAELEIPLSDEPIHVYLFQDEAKFREFMSRNQPAFPQRRAFFIKSDTKLTVYAFWGERVAEDLRHEVTHGYLHAVVPDIPLWMDEGIAEYFEVQRGLDGVNQPHIKLLADAYRAAGWQPNLSRLEQLDSTVALTQLDYAESWLWIHFLLRTDAQTNGMVCRALQQYRVQGTSVPLSSQVESWLPNWEEQIIAHLRSLADGL